jgi:phospholipid/cholesterol/gamma-HCH transport system substrate-binding protein
LKIRREIKLGILAVVTLFLFIWGINYLKGRDIFKRQLKFFVVYDEVTGLIESNPVSLNGLAIGQVKRISFHPDRSGRILVECLIGDQIDIPLNSQAVMVPVGLIGAREIDIRLGDSHRLLSPGDTLEGIFQAALQDELARQFTPVKEQAESLLARMDTVLSIVSQVLSPAAREELGSGIGNLSATLSRLENVSLVLDTTLSAKAGELSGIIGHTASIAKTVEENNHAIERILQNFSRFSDTLASMEITETMENARESLEELSLTLEKINRGEGSMGLFITDPQLYQHLESSSRQLELLLEDIRNNPRKYFSISVFGR